MTGSLVVRAGVGEIERVRAVRLAALADSPDAFWTTHAHAAGQPAQYWHDLVAGEGQATFLASVDGRDVGMARGSAHHDLVGPAGLYGMWVAPQARRAGVGSALIAAVIDWARAQRYPHLLLEVVDTNARAIATYRARGFVATGRTSTMPAPREHLTEHELGMDLTSATGPFKGEPGTHGW